VDGRQQRLDLFQREIPIHGAEAAACATILILQSGSHRRVERLAIHAVQRATEHAIAIKQRKREIALLHAARVVLRVHLRQQFEQFRHGLCGRFADGGECLSSLDSQPEIGI
jgi:hypothetical protein